MKVTLICRSFDKSSGQGIYKMAGYLYENLQKYSNAQIEKIEAYSRNPYYFDLIECPGKTLNKISDVYHFLMPEVSLPILFFKQIREKSVVTIHDAIVYKIKERKWLSEKYIKFMYNIAKLAKHIITPSYQSKGDIIRFLNVEEEKISVVPWSVDLGFFKPIRKRKTNHRKLVIGYLGGLGKRKKVEWLLLLAKKFKDDIFVKIAGSGPQLQKLIKLKEKLQVENVEFVGFISESKLPQFYTSLDVFIFPSLYEGFGIPLLEAMACEVPYIIGTNAGIGEILPIYKVDSFKEFKTLLKEINEGKIILLKNQRRWLIKNKLTWKEHIKKLVEIYGKV